MSNLFLAIDPGPIESAYVLLREDYTCAKFEKLSNETMIWYAGAISPIAVVIEKIESYGMAVGREVFDTCFWVGRFFQILNYGGVTPYLIPRRDVKLHLCGDSRAKDSNIRRALIDRFAQHDLKNGKGTKKRPDWFYRFHDDIWQAYALGVTWLDQKGEKA